MSGILALSPLLVFLGVYLVSSLIAGDFYLIPISAAFLVSCIYAVAIGRGSLNERIEAFSRGAGHPKVLLMIWIFILAGAFAGTAKDIGAVDATVALMLGAMPPRIMLAGLFVTACFISMAVGTSVGTIVALVPIAVGIAEQTGLHTEFVTALVVGGAFFGDNLSFISDTTIASTQAAGCEMADKFKANITIALPAFIIAAAIYVVIGRDLEYAAPPMPSDWYKITPYLAVILLSLLRCNVTLVLTVGIAINAVLGFACGSFGWTGFLGSTGAGIASMTELVVVTLLAGGLLELIRREGGLDMIISALTRRIRGRVGAEASIAALTCVANVCTANNTIAIITAGGIARDIADRYGIPPRRTASLLDTFSCLVQGLLPYGAQLLMAAGFAAVSPAAIIPYLYYPFLLGGCAIISIFIGRKNT